MALSAGYRWDSVSHSSLSTRKHSKLSTQRSMEGRLYQRNHHWNLNGKSTLFVNGVLMSNIKLYKRLQLVSATPVGQSPNGELGMDDSEEDKLHLSQDEDSKNDNGHLPMGKAEGKPGFISFHRLPYQMPEEIIESSKAKEPSNLLWFIGPSVLVASFILPSLYMRKLVLFIFEDSLLTDFLILFFTEALFYGGVAVFVLLIDLIWRPLRLAIPTSRYFPKTQFGLRISSVATLVLSLIIPFATMGMVWPWTGPAASATLAPYLVGLVVQFAFEQYARRWESTAWPVIPVIFQVYRMHQLNRAAQLVTALSISVRGAETTSQTLAINNSLGTLLSVLQLLGVICMWSLSSFLMRFIPCSPANPDP